MTDDFKFREGIPVKFKASNVNTGAVTINGRKLVTLRKDGKPLQAGDLVADEVVTFDRDTGEVLKP